VGLKPERRKPDEGVLVTKWKQANGTAFQYHLFIPSNVEPARIYVGSVSSSGGSFHQA